MKNFSVSAISICCLFACKTPVYHYVPPTINTNTYAGAGQGQVGLQFGTIGIGAKGGIAIHKNISLNAWGGIFPEADNGYNSRESEFSIGFQTNPVNNSATSFFIGLGNGNNEKDKVSLAGNFNRSFFQVHHAAFDKNLFKTKARFDGYIGLRINYMDYNGVKNSASFDHHLFYYEPYLGGSIGGKNVRLEILQGLAIKNSGEWSEGLRIFPYFANIGLVVKFGKGR